MWLKFRKIEKYNAIKLEKKKYFDLGKKKELSTIVIWKRKRGVHLFCRAPSTFSWIKRKRLSAQERVNRYLVNTRNNQTTGTAFRILFFIEHFESLRPKESKRLLRKKNLELYSFSHDIRDILLETFKQKAESLKILLVYHNFYFFFFCPPFNKSEFSSIRWDSKRENFTR